MAVKICCDDKKKYICLLFTLYVYTTCITKERRNNCIEVISCTVPDITISNIHTHMLKL